MQCKRNRYTPSTWKCGNKLIWNDQILKKCFHAIGCVYPMVFYFQFAGNEITTALKGEQYT
jgi:hypothetical protein